MIPVVISVKASIEQLEIIRKRPQQHCAEILAINFDNLAYFL